MNKQKQLVSLLGAGALVMGMLAATAGTALAADNTQFWAGNGANLDTDTINTSDCETDSSAHQLWIWTGTGSNVTISVDGEVVVGVQQGNGAYHFATGWHDIGDLTTGNGGNVFVTYDGAVDANAVLTLSHGCPGEEVTPPPTPEVTPTFGLETGDITDAPSEPSTDSIGTNGTSAPADGAWLLVVALGVLLASIVVLTPARAKSRR